MWEVEYKAYYANLQDRYNKGLAEGIVQTVQRMNGSIETAAEQLEEQCDMNMEKALETAKLYW